MTRLITEIYDEYQIPPWLAEHMLRVAAVAAMLFDIHKAVNPSLEGRTDLIAANLLHDVGNIIKFDFVKMPAPDGRDDYWREAQSVFKEKFGNDELHAAEIIMRELGVLSRAYPILEYTSFPYGNELLSSGTLLQKISAYADQRVGPDGIVSLTERLAYMHRRYSERGSFYGDTTDPKIQILNEAIYTVERSLFAGLSIRPEDINDESVAPVMAQLRSFEI